MSVTFPNRVVKLNYRFSASVGSVGHIDLTAINLGIFGINCSAVETEVVSVELDVACADIGTECIVTGDFETADAVVSAVVANDESFAVTSDITVGTDLNDVIVCTIALTRGIQLTVKLVAVAVHESIRSIDGNIFADNGTAGNIEPIIIGIVDGNAALDCGGKCDIFQCIEIVTGNIAFQNELSSVRVVQGIADR